MGTVHISGGSFKGRGIPFDNRFFDNADITTQKVKEALFSLTGDLSGLVFADLFGGSGQISMEALSRGAERVVCSETDAGRFRFISSFVQTLPGDQPFTVLHMPAERAMRYMSSKNIHPDIIFMDPPYIKTGSGRELYTGLLDSAVKYENAGPDTVIIFQHFSKNDLPDEYLNFRRIKERIYGSTTLSIYRKK